MSSLTEEISPRGLPLFRAEKMKPYFGFKGFWDNAKHYATTEEHAQKYLADEAQLVEESLPHHAKILDITGKGDFMNNLITLRKEVSELRAAWNKYTLRFDLEVIKKMGYDGVKFNDALGETVVK
jgi:hypothetical protein